MDEKRSAIKEIVKVIAMALFIIALAVLANVFVACSPRIYPPAESDTRTDTVIRVETIHDSVPFVVPVEVERIVTRDTMSHLENSFAKSDAVVKDGFLHHSLESKPQTIYVPYTVEVHDTTVVYKESEVIVKEVEKDLNIWQSFLLVLGILTMVAIVGFITYKLVSRSLR